MPASAMQSIAGPNDNSGSEIEPASTFTKKRLQPGWPPGGWADAHRTASAIERESNPLNQIPGPRRLKYLVSRMNRIVLPPRLASNQALMADNVARRRMHNRLEEDLKTIGSQRARKPGCFLLAIFGNFTPHFYKRDRRGEQNPLVPNRHTPNAWDTERVSNEQKNILLEAPRVRNAVGRAHPHHGCD